MIAWPSRLWPITSSFTTSLLRRANWWYQSFSGMFGVAQVSGHGAGLVDAPRPEELDIDPDVAAADDVAIDAMAAFFANEPEPVLPIPAQRKPSPYKRG